MEDFLEKDITIVLRPRSFLTKERGFSMSGYHYALWTGNLIMPVDLII